MTVIFDFGTWWIEYFMEGGNGTTVTTGSNKDITINLTKTGKFMAGMGQVLRDSASEASACIILNADASQLNIGQDISQLLVRSTNNAAGNSTMRLGAFLIMSSRRN